MTFGEWLEEELREQRRLGHNSPNYVNLLKLVRVQRQALKKVSQYTSLTEFVELAYEMNAIEAALMEK